MRFDAKVEVVCDGCDAEEWWEPQFVYMTFNGGGGHYDTSDEAFEKWCDRNGWIEDANDRTFCEMCAEEQNKPET